MSTWKEENKDIGTLKEDESCTVEFYYVGKCIPKSVSVVTSCGCTDGKWDSATKVLRVKFGGRKIPKHLNVDTQRVSKSVKMRYLCDNSKKEDILTFKATIVKKE